MLVREVVFVRKEKQLKFEMIPQKPIDGNKACAIANQEGPR